MLRIQPMQNHGDVHAHAHGAHPVAIGDAYGDAAATLTAVEADDGDEGLRGEMQAGKMTLVQCGGDIVAVDPGRPEFFKRSLGAAADGDTGVLQDFNAWVEDGTLRCEEVRGGGNS